MYDLRLQLGFNFDALLTAVANEQPDISPTVDPEALSSCVSMALNALEGADYIAITLTKSHFVQQVIKALVPLVRHRSLLRIPEGSADLLALAKVLQPAQVCVVSSNNVNDVAEDTDSISFFCNEVESDESTELLMTLPSHAADAVAALPDTVEGVCIDARMWSGFRGPEREQKLEALVSIIEKINESDRFACLTQLSSLKDAEEAAALPGVSAIEIGASLLPTALHNGLGITLRSLLDTLVKSQDAGLRLALEDHEHHHHDHDEDCGCHH